MFTFDALCSLSWLRYVDTVSTLGLRPLLVLLESASNKELLLCLCCSGPVETELLCLADDD